MNASILRGLAVLSMLSFLPRSNALTLVQSTTIDVSGFTSGKMYVPLIAEWEFTPFNFINVQLDSVEITGVVSIDARVTEYNPLLFPQMNGAFVIFESFLQLGKNPGQQIALNVSQTQSQDVPPAIIPPAQPGFPPNFPSQTINYSLTNSFTTSLSSPGDLQFFVSGAAPLVQHSKYGGWTSWGDSNARGTSTLTITYNYHEVPEGGSAALLAAGSFGVCLIICRRKKFVGPGVNIRRGAPVVGS